MPIVDLNVDYEDVKDADKFEVVPNASYDAVLKTAELGTSGQNSKVPGRPQIKWTIGITSPDSGKEVTLFYYTSLPWIPPGATEIDLDGLGKLVALCKGVGQPWTGGQVDTDAYIGLAGTVDVVQKNKQEPGPDGRWVDVQPPEPRNEIKRFVY